MRLIDYRTKQTLATFEGTNPRNVQLQSWLNENDYLIHRKWGKDLIVIRKGV